MQPPRFPLVAGALVGTKGSAVHRRQAFAALLAGALVSPVAGVRAQGNAAAARPFTEGTVRDLARDLAKRPHRMPDARLPRGFTDLSYDDYRKVTFDRTRALWRGQDLGFEAQFFHRGFLYTHKVELYEVADRQARPIAYDPTAFNLEGRPAPDADTGFAGFRITHPLNRPGVFDEICAFLGASYFRAVAKDLRYGLSARGLAIKTADPSGEEFPLFRAFWLERPQAGTSSIVVHALLDSPSATASFRFTIRPGASTVFDVQSTVFPRADVALAGIAPLTSMFYFAPNDRAGIDDYRNAVHDSDGLMVATSRGEQLWRPLQNPRNLQISHFTEINPRGFGLMQRGRDFGQYNDLEAHYELRPSLWVEPIADWGPGSIQLIEIPTDGEMHDNIVAFWRPEQPMRTGEEYNFVYRLHWLPTVAGNTALAQFVSTRVGSAGARGRLFVLDIAGGREGAVPEDAQPTLDLSTNAGELRNAVVQRNPQGGGWRVHFELRPGTAPLAELRAVLRLGDRPITETWLYRWTA
ncbi:glucan biosynthesis protein G [Roseomonas stagni]|uniref:Glucan biosynthesis protein G n=1 Tax=Falsiroseomonas algicola TaxID=2716930 RepID=A0A6M1LSF2_9PROT|nr:glucan biosynthesis protein G [Falsiroseomonas algicola]